METRKRRILDLLYVHGFQQQCFSGQPGTAAYRGRPGASCQEVAAGKQGIEQQRLLPARAMLRYILSVRLSRYGVRYWLRFFEV